MYKKAYSKDKMERLQIKTAADRKDKIKWVASVLGITVTDVIMNELRLMFIENKLIPDSFNDEHNKAA